MRFVNSKVTELWPGKYVMEWIFLKIYLSFVVVLPPKHCMSLGNVFNEIEVAFASGIGWLITFCAETGGKVG